MSLFGSAGFEVSAVPVGLGQLRRAIFALPVVNAVPNLNIDAVSVLKSVAFLRPLRGSFRGFLLLMAARFSIWAALAAMLLGGSGCGTFLAHRLAQAPNTYPTWFAPEARVVLGFDVKFLTNFPARFVTVGPPSARLRYRVVPPADYHLTVASTNWLARGVRQYDFTFHADVPAPTNQWTQAPRGTVVLLHGWGVGQFAMAPWALRLAQEGWQCVLVDLRGHGRSTGRQIFFGLRETTDLSQLLDRLASDQKLVLPVAAVGESYGAALALRWKTTEPRLGPVVAIAPYADLSNAVVNISHDYAAWVPDALIRAGLRQLPAILQANDAELDTTTVVRRGAVTALFVAGTADRVTPLAEVRQLAALAGPGSQLIEVPDATHEAVTYFFTDLVPPVLQWLAAPVIQTASP